MSRALAAFFSTLVLLAVLRLAMAYIRVPEILHLPASFLITVAFIVLPILALFKAGGHPWTPKLAILFVAVGMAVQFLLPLIPVGEKGFGPVFMDAVAQQGLPMWTVGLGALLALMLKDKNLLLPVSIFLALFDIFLVFTPVGFVQVLMEKAPNLLPAMAHKVPQVATTTEAAGVPVGTFAHIGPADFLFMGMFFIALYRFQMRTEATFKWLLLALAIYLPLVLIVGPVPLLVPIGLTVLAVNIREFKMTGEEKISTALVAAIGVGIVVFAATRPKPEPRVAPSPAADVPMPRESEGSLGPT